MATNNQEKANVEIVALNGKVLQTTMLENGAGQINLQDLKAGLYLVRITQNSNISVSRIIVQ